MTTFLRWSGLAAGILFFGGLAGATAMDLKAGDACFVGSGVPRIASFLIFVLSGSVTIGLLAVAARAMRPSGSAPRPPRIGAQALSGHQGTLPTKQS